MNQGRLALWLPVAAILGDALYFAVKAEAPLWPAPLLFALALTILLRVQRIGVALLIAGFAFGFGAAQIATLAAPPFTKLPTRAAILAGTITAVEPLPTGRRVSLAAIRLNDAAIGPRTIRLHLQDSDTATLIPGQTIVVRARLQPPTPPTSPGARDLQRDAYFAGLNGTASALGPVAIQSGPTRPAPLARLRAAIAARIAPVLPGPPGAIAATLLTGQSQSIPAADRAAFAAAGLAHLLAIAGLHIGIVMGLALGLARWLLGRSEHALLFWPTRALSALAALTAGLIYLLLTGTHVPILRAFIMASLVTLAVLTGRRAASFRGWGLAVLVVIAVAPESVTQPSFQLSFAAVLALIAGYESLRPFLLAWEAEGGWPRRLAGHIAALALTSTLAGTASIPFIAYHFGAVQPYFVAANLLAVPITAFWVMPAGLMALALMPLGLERLALIPMGAGIRALLWLAHQVASWPDATLRLPHPPVAALLAAALALAWLCLSRGPTRLLAVPVLAATLLSPFLLRPPDILLSADSRLLGLRHAGDLALLTARGGDAYVQSQWLTTLAANPMPLDCPEPCRWQPRPHVAAAMLAGPGALDCTNVALVIAMPGQGAGCPHATRLDRQTTWQDGAQAIWLTQAGATILSDRADRGRRPWVWLGPEQQRAALTLPMAQTEILPPP